MYKVTHHTNSILGDMSFIEVETQATVRRAYKLAFNEHINNKLYQILFYKLILNGKLKLPDVTVTRIQKGEY